MTDDRPCPDCGVPVGAPHGDGCDVARCLATGEQLMMCGGEIHEFYGREYGEHEGDCGHDVWTGEWPGDADASALGWFGRFTLPYAGRPRETGPWERCGPDDEGARPDLSRLVTEGRWDREQARWVAR